MTIPPEKLRELYFSMIKIRKAEEAIVALYPEQEIRCPAHLYIGEEAIAAGVCAALSKDDAIFTNHRSHGHYLAKGGNLKSFFAELYGKQTGCSRGFGGSMHLIDKENGVWGGSAIVGGAIPIATGVALSFKLKKENRVVVSFFGDGAVEEGTFHESLNFASLWKLPVVFVCENNFYASQTGLARRESNPDIHRKAAAYNIPGMRIDGTDVLEVFEAAQNAVDSARNGNGPILMEAAAYRWKGHVGCEEDYKMGYRTKNELDQWKEKCPIKKMKNYLAENKILNNEQELPLLIELEKEISEAVFFAKNSPAAKLNPSVIPAPYRSTG